MLGHKIRVAMWNIGWKLYTLADKWQEKEELGDFVDHWECGIELLENHTGCKCVETQWADGGENTRNEPMVTFKWPGVAKAIKKCYKGLHLNDFEDYPDIMRSVADLMEVHNALLEGKPIDLKLLTRILEEEIGNWSDAIADESAWPERDPFGYTTQTIHNAQACKKLLEIALALLK